MEQKDRGGKLLNREDLGANLAAFQQGKQWFVVVVVRGLGGKGRKGDMVGSGEE